MKGKAVAGTFHKTGTVLIRSILRQGSEQLGFVVWDTHKTAEPARWDIAFHPHCAFPGAALAQAGFGAIVIRDPRDVIISGAHHHMHCTDLRVNAPDVAFGGRSYQQTINALASMEERLVFEARHRGWETTQAMLRVTQSLPQSLPRVHVARFEALAVDTDLIAFGRLFRRLGFRGDAVQVMRTIAQARSIFGGNLGGKPHIRSGAPEQWRRAMSPAVLREVRLVIGDAPERLGYPPD